MCGRFSQTQNIEQVLRRFEAGGFLGDWRPRFNIAPTNPVLAIRAGARDRQAVWLRWGLVPPWADDPSIGHRMINARSETLADKPSFREPFKQQRCIIPADGYYEWKKAGGRKQPMHFRLRSGDSFGMAGLWAQWTDRQTGESIETCTIITVPPNALSRSVHDRMPAMLRPGDEAAWLDPSVDHACDLAPLLRPYDNEAMAVLAVNPKVNRPGFEGPACLEPVTEDKGLFE